MGCDIHLHIEVKINGKWEHYSAPYVNRWYDLFGKMAGVRSDEEPIAEPRGLPDDATAVTFFDAKRGEGDYHNHSWLDAREIRELEQWVHGRTKSHSSWHFENWGFVFGNYPSSFIEYPDDRVEGWEDIRFVFWFGN